MEYYIKQVVQKNVNNTDALSFWLANVCRLFHNLKQYSGDEVCGQPCICDHMWCISNIFATS